MKYPKAGQAFKESEEVLEWFLEVYTERISDRKLFP